MWLLSMSPSQCPPLNVPLSMSPSQCPPLNVPLSMSPSQCPPLNVSLSMSPSQCPPLNVPLSMSPSKTFATDFSKFSPRTPPHNSNLGMLADFRVVTQHFDITMLEVISSCGLNTSCTYHSAICCF